MAMFLSALCVGLLSGFTSGLCGISPGGALVVFATLLLRAEQHMAQALSLAVQIPPTSLAGLRRYREGGSRCPRSWLILLGAGVLVGGAAGAVLATTASTRLLQWTYVLYLSALAALLLHRARRQRHTAAASAEVQQLHWAALITVGSLAGLSSGFLGIGGGLVVVAGLSAALKVAQHRAQMISLMLSAIPTTLPAAYVYWRRGLLVSWPILVAVVIGLCLGTNLGARLAVWTREATLRRILIAMITAMTAYMTWSAL
jgi:uncharacterized membrane protein YfcA